MKASILNAVLMGTFGIGLNEAMGISPQGIANRSAIAEDRKLVDRIQANMGRLNGEDAGVMLEAFEFIDPTGLRPRPMPANIRAKVKALADRLDPPTEAKQRR